MLLLKVSVGLGCELPLTRTRLIGQIDQMLTFKYHHHVFARPNTLVVSHCSCISLRKNISACVCVCDFISAHSDTCCPADSGLTRLGIYGLSIFSFPVIQLLLPKHDCAIKPCRLVKTEISVDEFAGITQNLIRRTTPLASIADFSTITRGLYLRPVSVSVGYKASWEHAALPHASFEAGKCPEGPLLLYHHDSITLKQMLCSPLSQHVPVTIEYNMMFP